MYKRTEKKRRRNWVDGRGNGRTEEANGIGRRAARAARCGQLDVEAAAVVKMKSPQVAQALR